MKKKKRRVERKIVKQEPGRLDAGGGGDNSKAFEALISKLLERDCSCPSKKR